MVWKQALLRPCFDNETPVRNEESHPKWISYTHHSGMVIFGKGVEASLRQIFQTRIGRAAWLRNKRGHTADTCLAFLSFRCHCGKGASHLAFNIQLTTEFRMLEVSSELDRTFTAKYDLKLTNAALIQGEGPITLCISYVNDSPWADMGEDQSTTMAGDTDVSVVQICAFQSDRVCRRFVAASESDAHTGQACYPWLSNRCGAGSFFQCNRKWVRGVHFQIYRLMIALTRILHLSGWFVKRKLVLSTFTQLKKI